MDKIRYFEMNVLRTKNKEFTNEELHEKTKKICSEKYQDEINVMFDGFRNS
jgi:hypothetical protein